MTEGSKLFEQRVEHIHKLLEAEDAVITWNDRIHDPDNLNQLRQIDVTIRRDKSLTLVECRIHKTPQDVTWIEELIGRRASLRADTVIAVSNSGFTEGAEAKASQFGIILRDFSSLTQEEVRNWGRQRKVQLVFWEFTENIISFRLPEFPKASATMADVYGRPVNWRGLFEPLMRKLEDDKRMVAGAVATCNAEFDAPIFVDGVRAIKSAVRCKARRITRDVSLSGVVAYADPVGNQGPLAHVGSLDLGSSEIVEVADHVIVVIDLSQISIPTNCLFHTIFYDFGRVVEMRGARFIGLHDALNFQNAAQFQFEVT